MDSANSVTLWIGQLKAGDADAAQKIWERDCAQLLRLASNKLKLASRRVADEEDLALSAFKSFCLRAARGGFTKLADRGDLWQLLFVLTERKARNLVVHERRQKRDVGRQQDAFATEEMVSPEPSPAFAAEVAEEFQRLLDLLDDDELRFVVVWKMEGYSNEEIAMKLDCVARTVERKLNLIRKIWEKSSSRPS